MVEKTVINTTKVWTVEGQHGLVQSTFPFAIRSVIGSVFGDVVDAGNIQKATMKIVMHPSLITAVFDALLKIDDLKVSIAMYVLKYIEKETNRAKMDIELFGSK